MSQTEKRPLSKQVFVAYAYTIYDKRDYRRIYKNLEKAFDVTFIFADEKITNMHILQKIISYIRGSDFSLFDISAWNPNVTLELGIALATNENWYICFNPSKTNVNEVPSDIRGIDRIQYSSFSDLEDRLSVLLEQWYSRSTRRSVEDFVESAQRDIVDLLQRQEGLGVTEIGEILGMNKNVVKVIVRDLVAAEKVRVKGKTRGAKYFPA